MRTLALLSISLLAACTRGGSPHLAMTESPPVEQAAQAGGADISASGLTELARAALARGDAAAALPLAQRAVDAAPTDAEANRLLAQSFLITGRADDAEVLLARLLKDQPDNLTIKTEHALSLLAMGEADEAKTELRSVLLAKPEPSVLSNAGFALALAGEAKEAAAAMAPVALSASSTTQLRQNYALALTLAGDRSNAYTIAVHDLGASRAVSQIDAWHASIQKPLSARLTALSGIPSQAGAIRKIVAQESFVPAPDTNEPKAEKAIALNPSPRQAMPLTPLSDDNFSGVGLTQGSNAATQSPEAGAKGTSAEKHVGIQPIAVGGDAKTTPVVPIAFTTSALAPASSASVEKKMMAVLNGWMVQIASVSASVQGQDITAWVQQQFGALIARLGPTSIQNAEVNQKPVRRIMVGPYPSQARAAQVCSSLKAKGKSCFVQKAAAESTDAKI